MIRINLLPFRAARRKENIRRQLTIYVLTVVLSFLVLGYLFIDVNSTLGGLYMQKAQKTQDLKKYDPILRKIAKLEKKIKEIEAKLGVIEELKKNKTGPVLLLDQIAEAIPKDKLWLTSLKESAGTLTLNGTAMDNDTVARFMTNLERSEHITSVELQSTRLKNLSQYKLNVSDFVLVCKTYSFKVKEPKTKKKRRR
jgi:type IV pilus assembly protein PilN